MKYSLSFDEKSENVKYVRCVLNGDLDDIIVRATKDIQLIQMKEMAAAKDRFIRKVFHEIRTPMHAISSSIASSKLTKVEVEDLSLQVLIRLFQFHPH